MNSENNFAHFSVDTTADAIIMPWGTYRRSFLGVSFIRLSQVCAWFIVAPIFYLCFRIRIHGRESMKELAAPVIFIANHISYYDSFLLSLVCGMNSPLLPLRFMAVKKFNWRWLTILGRLGVIDLIYGLFGVFLIVPGRGITENLREAKAILANGSSVVIYPEGKIVQAASVGQFRPGAAKLALDTGVTVVPISFRLTKSGGFRKLLTIKVGQAITNLPSRSMNEITAQFQNIVSRMYDETK